jgi:hypothetical protein
LLTIVEEYYRNFVTLCNIGAYPCQTSIIVLW